MSKSYGNTQQVSDAVIAHRNGKTIIMFPEDKAARTTKTYSYINQAKRASRELQDIHGLRSVRVVR